MAEKKEERTLEMRVAELESRLGVGAQQMEFTEQEVAAYNKIADALGVGVGAQLSPMTNQCIRSTCAVYPCRLQTCRIQSCRVQTCLVYSPGNSCHPHQPGPCRVVQCIGQRINQCVACYASDYEADWSGGFSALG